MMRIGISSSHGNCNVGVWTCERNSGASNREGERNHYSLLPKSLPPSINNGDPLRVPHYNLLVTEHYHLQIY